jgi:hypothetical protein
MNNYKEFKDYYGGCLLYLQTACHAFYPCCGMQLRLTPSNKEGKERLRQERRLVKIR